jgi:osomolarity two-component system sensor histidine kinase TcsA
MSHEIRTPMHGMLSACALLRDTTPSEKQREILGIMDESGQVLLQVINDILDYSKLTSGNFSIHSDMVGITSIVTSVIRTSQATLPPSVHFELFLAPDLPRSVQGDPLRYRQVLQNLVSNAAKFTDRGNIRLQASVQSEDDAGYNILTEVIDTGIGVPTDAIPNLFTPFTQFDTSTTAKRSQGTGLGLSIAKSLAELMGGTVGYSPNPDHQGSIFWFTARVKKIKSLDQMQNWNTPSPTAEGPTSYVAERTMEELQQDLGPVSSTKNLLVVEDNLINQKVMMGMLRSLGFRNIGLAANGAEALGMVRNKPAAYDVVLMDINMPVMDGHAASKAIRTAGIDVPIVAMTAYALKGDKERCLENGMNDYITKPVDKEQLVRVLAKWLLSMPDYRKSFDGRGADRKGREGDKPQTSPGGNVDGVTALEGKENPIAEVSGSCVVTNRSSSAQFVQQERPLVAEDEAVAFSAPAAICTRGGGDAAASSVQNQG